MIPEMVIAQVEGTTQAALLSGLAGNSYTVSQVMAAGNGMETLLLLSPDGGASAAGNGVVALKLEGTRQAAQMSSLIGKSVTIGKAPLVAGGASKWVVFYPKAAMAAKAAAGASTVAFAANGAIDSQAIMLQLEGAKSAAQMPLLSGKTFTVIKSTAAVGGQGKWLFLQPVGDAAGTAKEIVALKVQHGATQVPWLVGKTFTVGQAPIMAADNVGKYLFLQPASGIAGKGAVGAAMAAKGVSPTMQTIALQATGKGAIAKGAAAAVAGKGAATAAGTIWTGTGMSLGLGLGLGTAGPVILGGLVGLAGYGFYRYRKNRAARSENEVVIDEALAS
jgi:hypothetical protein